ncbi:probable methyltransferase-like protein 24 isoform X1 [Artemia franciscana]|uniref:probable methyltransferase-like protein 24 isoform X1 n=1 Tax=Artemia franciscana TaxID=6661 RepID=UPI0032DB5C18
MVTCFPSFHFPRRQDRLIIILLSILLTIALYQNYSAVPLSKTILEDVPEKRDYRTTKDKLKTLAAELKPSDDKITSYEQVGKIFLRSDEGACKSQGMWGGRIWNGVYLIGKGWTDAMDGNYTLCMDPGVAPNQKSCLVYSFGIANNWSFDEDAEKYGCEVYSFDPSIGQKPHMHSAKVHFYDYGLSNVDTDQGPNGWRMRRLESLMTELGHSDRIIDVLKIDIEDSEHDVIPEIVSSGIIKKVKQIVWEIHNFKQLPVAKFFETFSVLEKAGFEKFFSENWPYPNESFKKVDGTYDMTFYIFSHYNKKFLQKST